MKTYIGIDVGLRNTAIADYRDGIIANLKTMPFVYLLMDVNTSGYWDILYEIEAVIVIEDPNHNRPTFDRGTSEAAKNKISQNVGANKVLATVLIEYLKGLGYTVEAVPPQNKKQLGTKKGPNADKMFRQITGWEGKRTNEHERDSAMLVFGR